MNKRNYCQLLICNILILLSTFCYGQSHDVIIKNIKDSFQKINSDSTLKTIKLENGQFLEHMTDGGGSLTGYFKNDTINKIKVWIGLSYGVKQYEYYLKNGQLFFVYEKEEDFPYNDSKGSFDYTKLNLAFEGRYYLNNGQIIDIKTKGQKRFEKKSNNQFIKDLISDSKSYTNLLQLHLKRKK